MYSIKFPAGNSYISSSAVMAKKCTIMHCAMCIVIAKFKTTEIPFLSLHKLGFLGHFLGVEDKSLTTISKTSQNTLH